MTIPAGGGWVIRFHVDGINHVTLVMIAHAFLRQEQQLEVRQKSPKFAPDAA